VGSRVARCPEMNRTVRTSKRPSGKKIYPLPNSLVSGNLARSAKLPTGLYIFLALISFFFPFLSLTFSRRQIISGSAGTIFVIFSPNESVLGADDRSGPLFSIPQGTLPWQPIKVEKSVFL